MHSSIPIWFPIVFIAIWVAISLLTRYLSGWYRLEQFYDDRGKFSGKRRRLTGGYMNNVSISSSLLIYSNEQGVFISSFIIYRLIGKPLLIPWNDISIFAGHHPKPPNLLSHNYIEFHFSQVPDVVLGVIESEAIQLLEAKPRIVGDKYGNWYD